MGEVDDAADTKNKRKAHRHQKQRRRLCQAVQNRNEVSRKLHSVAVSEDTAVSLGREMNQLVDAGRHCLTCSSDGKTLAPSMYSMSVMMPLPSLMAKEIGRAHV